MRTSQFQNFQNLITVIQVSKEIWDLQYNLYAKEFLPACKYDQLRKYVRSPAHT